MILFKKQTFLSYLPITYYVFSQQCCKIDLYVSAAFCDLNKFFVVLHKTLLKNL